MQSEPTEPQPPADPPPAQQPVRIRPVARRPALPPPPAKKRLVIGGLECFVYGLDKVKDEIPRVVLFLLHGRGSDHSCFEEFIRFLDLRSINRSRVKRQLYSRRFASVDYQVDLHFRSKESRKQMFGS